jgi:p-hydroxybenzoate 3-monooxygenase
VNTAEHRTTVVIVGAGVAGLALGNMLLRNGIDCLVLERRSRDHVEQRQRAGALDGKGVRVLRDWGLEEVFAGQVSTFAESGEVPLLIDGETHYWNAAPDDDAEGVFCTQQVLVRNLIAVFLRDGGDLRFGVDHVEIGDLDADCARVHYRDAGGTTTQILCDLVAGCDGDRGVSRTAPPDGALTRHSHEHGFAWLAVLADVPANPPAVMAIHDRGFAAQITRGPDTSRFYLQCPLRDTLEHWPDERIWRELATRFGTSAMATGPITDRALVPLRGVVYSPMSHARLHLVGDAAHIVSPMSAKGMSLALHDAGTLARAVIRWSRHGEADLLGSYSDTCLRHIWDTQVSAVAITELMHDAGDASYAGEFRRQLARARLRSLVAGNTAGTVSA